MRVAVAGGTGVLGSAVVRDLAARGDEVLALSRGAPAELPDGASHRRVDLRSGDGLAAALEGIEAVVDAVNDPSRKAAELLVDGTRRLLSAEADAGVRHHVAISIVGIEAVPFRYYRAKIAQERVVTDGPVSWSLLRATQFHDLIAFVLGQAARLRLAPTGPARFQPVAAEVVAKRVADAVHDGPGGRLPDVAGPEIQTLTELSRAWRDRQPRRLLPLHLPPLGRAGRTLRDGALCNPAAATPGQTFEQWLTGDR